jgi:uncharacterized phage protein (TIGR01671 family)
MNRELKFRIWDNENKNWIDSWWLQFGSYNRLITDIGCYINLSEHSHNYIIQQYTGLKDKNCKEIYEGDIVKFIQWPNQSPLQIVFKDGVFTYDNTFYDFDGLLYPNECEIIGNIFETPDLLK